MIIEIRSSSFGLLMDCSDMWAAIQLDGMTRPSTPAAWMGTSIHYGSAIYDQDRIEGRTANVKQAVEAAVYKFDNPTEEVHWTADDYSKTDAKRITIQATELYCNDLSPQFEFSAVEMRPPPVDVELDGITIRLTGQMDRTRIIKGGNGKGISDLKTGKRIIQKGQVDTRGHKFQAGIYELLYEQHTHEPVTLPAVIAGVSTARRPQAGVGLIHGAKELIVGTSEQSGVLEKVARRIKMGDFTPNPRSMLCSPRYCPIYHRCAAHD